jgi:tetratricopeptide (TPR) repeat protein
MAQEKNEETEDHNHEDFKFKDMLLVRDDGFWLEMETARGHRVYVRDRYGLPVIQRGKPLRHRLLNCVSELSLHRRFPGGWEEHVWDDGNVIKSHVYYNRITHRVAYRPPTSLTAPKKMPLSRGARAPQPPREPSMGMILAGRRTSPLTSVVIAMLKEPNPDHARNVGAIAGFALLLIQNDQFLSARGAVRRAVALALLDEDVANGAGGQGGVYSAKQRSQLLFALSRLCLITNDFREAEKTCRLALSLCRSDADSLAMAGEILIHLSRPADAERVLVASLLQNANHAASYRAYARLCAMRGHFDHAHIYFQRAIQAKAPSKRDQAQVPPRQCAWRFRTL